MEKNLERVCVCVCVCVSMYVCLFRASTNMIRKEIQICIKSWLFIEKGCIVISYYCVSVNAGFVSLPVCHFLPISIIGWSNFNVCSDGL